MADKQGKGDNPLGQYKYAAMSNLVLQADRRFITRRGNENTGDPESLAGRISLRDMGARNAREAAPTRPPAAQDQARKRKRTEPLQTNRSAGILGQADLNIEGLRYRPKTIATKETYDLIATEVSRKMGGLYGLAVTASATDSILEFLKDDSMKDFNKKKEIEDIIGDTLSSREMEQLVSLGKKLTDYNAQDDDQGGNENGGDADIDERQGVAVDFGDDEEDDDERAGQTFEVHDHDEDSEDDLDTGGDGVDVNLGGAAQDDIAPGGVDEGEDDEGMVIETQPEQRETDRDSERLPAHEIDAFWLQRQIGHLYNDAHIQAEKSREAEQIMAAKDESDEDKPLREVENDLMELFDYDHPDLVQKLVKNRDKIIWVLKWRRVADDEAPRSALEKEMVGAGHASILREIHGRDDQPAPRGAPKLNIKLDSLDVDSKAPAPEEKKEGLLGGLQPRRTMNLEDMKFDQGRHLMTNHNVRLPQGSVKRTFKGYEEIHVPAPKPKHDPNEPALMPTSDLPSWAQAGFGTSKQLNRIQTKCFPAAFEDDGNMLICAPTGSGKTNVAMLAMLREIGKHRNPQTGQINLDAFKIVYVAPLKALVAEQAGNFGKRLEPYGIKVSELTGDRQLTRQQISETQVIITTPEKWDVITRKASDTSYTNLVRLVCIDEIHLLHDDRGPALESIISRTIRHTEQTGEAVRLIGLSATLPNYRDVATFLRVDPQKGLFHFDSTFRPCPLKQEFIGLTDKKPIKQLKMMNDVCYTKVLEQVGQNKNQMLIFVHSRKDTGKTAKYIRDKALELDTIGQILRVDAASREILREEAEQVADQDLKDVLPYGFGLHHAGMSREDRTSVEDLFSDGAIQVLVCTATLAWGVNLPAHTVIIKGTQVYEAQMGSWVELSPQDVLQMLGRAGRPQYDTYGEGIIITTQTELQFYLSLLNQQLPIESQFISKLADNLNAEVVLGNVRSRDEGVEWLGYTYLFVRMLRSPALYQVGADYDDDETLEQMRVDLVHSAATALEATGLLKYDKKTGRFQATELGRIASHYYLTHNSMHVYNRNLQPYSTPIDLMRTFAMSDEFKYIPVRQDEKLELAKLVNRVPIPVKETVEEPSCKINVLLQTYISRLQLDGLAVITDMAYATGSASRIMRAMFEIALKKGYSMVAKDALELCKTVDRRMWTVMSPLRQFPGCPEDIIKKAERVDVPWSAYYDLDPPQMGELLGMPRYGRQVCNMVAKFPRLDLQAQVQPITPSLMKVELTITPKFEWDDALHGRAENWWIIVEDCDGEKILFHDQFLLRKEYATAENSEHLVEFTVMIDEPMPPVYFVTVVSDRWVKAESKLVLNFLKLTMPEKFPAHTPILDLQRLPVSGLKKQEYMDLYPGWENFNRLQTQTSNHLLQTDENVLVGSATGTGKTVCAEFALFRHWNKAESGKAVYIAPFQEQIDAQHKKWQSRLVGLGGGKKIVKLTGELAADLKALEVGDLILATPTQWDMMSRQWQRRKNVQKVKLVIADDLHMLGGHGGYIYELVMSRTQAVAVQLDSKIRIVALSVSLSNARDIGEWIGATKQTIYNFGPGSRTIPLSMHIQTFNIPHFPSLMIAMAKPVYHAILQFSSDKPAMVFVPSRKQVRATALDLLTACAADNNEDRFMQADPEELAPILSRVKERSLAQSLASGIGYYHEALSASDKHIVEQLFQQGAVQVMLVSRDCCWEIQSTAYFVVIMGMQYFEGREHRYVDYPISEMLEMLGKAGRSRVDKDCHGLIMCPDVKREFYTKFLREALPIESQLQMYLHDAFVTEISTKTIESTQDALDWTTYTFFYRRLLANPSYYGLKDTSHQGLSAHLSELAESTLNDLSEAKLIELDEDEGTVAPLNAAMIAAYYDISFVTMQTLLLSLKRTSKLKGILEIVTAATEFEDAVPIRRHEEPTLRRIYDRVPVKLAAADFESPHFKAFVLLQAHFSRMHLPADLAKDQEAVLRKVSNLLSAAVDVLSSEGHLNAMSAMEMSQMVAQAMWDRDSPLKQIPHFGDAAVEACARAGVKDVFEFMEAMDPSENKEYGKLVQAMGLSNAQLGDAARFTNERYPNVELSFELEDAESVVAGVPSVLHVTVEREVDEGDEGEPEQSVHAPFFPGEKTEGWWLVVGDESTKSLLAIKRVTVGRRALKARLELVVPTAGKHELTLFLMSDCYVGVDQAPTFEVDAAEGEEEDEEDDEEE